MMKTPSAADTTAAVVARKRAQMLRRYYERSQAARDIGVPHPPRNLDRRLRSAASLAVFCQEYFPDVFYLPFSDDHLEAISIIERAVKHGGLFAFAMPRGSGKTALCRAAVLWAILHGLRRHIVLIAASHARAEGLMEGIRTALEHNALLDDDFNEVTLPLRALEGLFRRSVGQLSRGERTGVGYTRMKLVLPSIAASPSAGSVIVATSLGSRIRGMEHMTQTGDVIRPDFVVVDDPQTDASARSPAQCERREQLLMGTILGMSGPTQRISAVMPCTVICRGDLADRMLDPARHPEWQGRRFSLLRRLPTNMELWAEYATIYREELAAGGDGTRATAFYLANRDAMDAGAIASWPARYFEGEVSAIQHAMNLRIRDEESFASEYQNQPLAAPAEARLRLEPEQLDAQVSNVKRGIVPRGVSYVTAYIDPHEKLHYWMVVGWDDQQRGWIIDYGTHPRQVSRYFMMRDCQVTLATQYRMPVPQCTLLGIDDVLAMLSVELPREEGGTATPGICVIDANWGLITDALYEHIRASKFAIPVVLSHGKAVSAMQVPISQWRAKPGSRIGREWYLMQARGRVMRAVYDTNFWKTLIARGLSGVPGVAGTILLPKPETPKEHRLLVDHLTSEYATELSGRTRTIDAWAVYPGRENHWFDCLVGCAVGASLLGLGAEFKQRRPAITVAKARPTLAELAKRARS